MNHERPQLTSEHSIREGIRHAIGQHAIVRPEERVYAQDLQPTLLLSPDNQPTMLPETAEHQPALTHEQYAEFDGSAEGRRIRSHWHRLQILEASLRLRQNYTVPVPSEGPARPEGIGELGELHALREWAGISKLGINFDALEADDVSADELTTALEAVNRAQEEILHLREELIRHPEIRIAKDVTVLRNGRDGQPDYLQRNWQVLSVRGDGRLSLLSDEQKLRKFATIDELLSWQDL